MSVIVGEVKISEKFEKNHSQFSGKYKTCLLDVVNDFPKAVLKITIKANPHVVANLDLRKLDKACVVTDSLSARFSNGTNVFIKKCRGARRIKELIDKATELPRLPRGNQSKKSQIICQPNNVDFIEIGRERTKIPIRNQPPVPLDEKEERKISTSAPKPHAVHGGIGGVLEENYPLFTQVKKRRSSEESHSGKETPVKLVSSMGSLSSKKHICPSDKKPPLSQITNQSNNVDSTQIGDDLQSGLVKTHETELTDDAQERRISTSTPKPKTFGRGKHESSDESDDNLPLFTYMKKRRVSTGETHTDGNTETTLGNESHKVKGDSSAKETTPNKFLDKAEQKSKLCENSTGLSSKSFYSTESSDRLHGSFGLSTSKTFTKKRPERKLFAFEPTKSVNYSWTPKSSAVVNSKSTLTGFSNLGNTCYMNAILQSLFSLDSFADDLTFLQNQTRRLEHCQKSLFFLLANLWESKKKKMSNERQNKCLTEVKQAISVTAKRFSGKEQHDAHEFLSQVIDQVKEETQKQNEKVAEMDKKRTNNNDERSPENKKKHDIMKDRYLNPAILNFEFEVLHKITCLKCLSEVKKIEIFHDLSIDMPKRMNCNDKSTLQDALDQFFQREKIDYTCEKCQHNQVEVSHTFYRAPRVVILQLKRYRFNSATTQNKKLVRNIGIPRFLTLSDHCTQETGPPYFLDMKDFYRVFRERDALTSTENMSVTPESKTRRTYTFKKPPSSVFAVDSKSSSTPKSTFKSRMAQEDEDLARALEESRSEKKQTDIRMYTSGMSEETQLKIAMELSLHDNEQNDTSSRTPNSRRSLGKSEPRSRSPKACSKRLKLGGQEDSITIISEGENRSAEINTGGDIEVKDRRDGGMFVEEMSMFTDSEPEDEKIGGNINEVKERKIECENDGSKEWKNLPEESCIETQKQSTNKNPDGEIIGKNMKKHRTHTEYMTLSSDSDSEKVPVPEADGTVSGKNDVKNEKRKCEEEDAKAPKQSPIMISSDPDWLIAKKKEEEDLDKAMELSLKESQALQSSSLQEKEDGDLRRAIELSLKEVSDDKEQSWTFEESFLDEPIQRSSHTAEEIKTNLKLGNLPYSYRLVSIVSHLGSSEAGHYISDVYSAEKDQWFSYNDKDVSQMPEESVLQTRENSGYIFFYVNRDILDTLATERKNREMSLKENISQSEKKTKQPGLFSARRSAPTALSFMNSSSIL